MRDSLKLSTRIWLSISILILGYVFSLFFSYYTSHQIQSNLSKISNLAAKSTDCTQKIITGFGRQNKFYEDAVMLGQAELVDEAKKESVGIEATLDSLNHLDGITEKNQQTIIEISTALKEYTVSANSVYAKMSGDEAVDVSEQDTAHLASENTKITQKLSALSIAVQHNVSDNMASLIQVTEKNNRINVILSFAIIGIAIFIIAIVIRRSITRVLYQISAGINQFSQKVGSGALQLSSASHLLAEGASEQAASIEETSSSLEEIAAMTKQNADNANHADSLMKGANQLVDKANGSMNDLTHSIKAVSVASEETQKIIKTIDEIAFQTNLLALNAAVEAARAGEAGAGFAVVADEVRNLAMRASEAAKNTAELIEGTVKKVDEGAGLVIVTNEAFKEVAANVSKGGHLVTEIAGASQEQAQGIEQLNTAVMEMDKVTQQNAANAEETASVSEEMMKEAEQMKEGINRLSSLVGDSGSLSEHEVKDTRAEKAERHQSPGSHKVLSMDTSRQEF